MSSIDKLGCEIQPLLAVFNRQSEFQGYEDPELSRLIDEVLDASALGDARGLRDALGAAWSYIAR